jgi:MraZ protein
VEELSKLNPYEQKNREFIRYFTRGATELTLDATGRVNLPKSLLESVGIEISAELVLACQFDKIEVWSKKRTTLYLIKSLKILQCLQKK